MLTKYPIAPPERVVDPLPDDHGECRDHDYELRRQICANGAVQFRRQCRKCGKTTNAIARKDLTPEEMDNAPVYDQGLEPRYFAMTYEARQVSRERERQEKQNDWNAWYSRYLQSPQWRERVRVVMARDHGMCECCGVVKATAVHHLTYEHVGQERLWELVAVCPECHDYLHGWVSL